MFSTSALMVLPISGKQCKKGHCEQTTLTNMNNCKLSGPVLSPAIQINAVLLKWPPLHPMWERRRLEVFPKKGAFIPCPGVKIQYLHGVNLACASKIAVSKQTYVGK